MHYGMTRPAPQGRYVRYNLPEFEDYTFAAYELNPWEPDCGRAYPRGHRLTAADRRRLPRGAFGLPDSRKYPMPDAVHAANAKARASAALERGQLTRREHRGIVRKADAILKRCGGVLAPAIPFRRGRQRRRIAANPYTNPGSADAYYDEDSPHGHHCPEDPRERCWICGARGEEESNPPSNPQTHWGAGGGYYQGSRFRPGGGRYLDPRYLGSPYDYHAGGGQRSHGFHPGSGYYANPGSLKGRIMAAARNYPHKIPGWRLEHLQERLDDGELDEAVNILIGSWGLWDLPPDVQAILDEHEAGEASQNPPYYERNPLHYPGIATYGYGHIPYFSPPGPGLIAPLANPQRRRARGAKDMEISFLGAFQGAAAHGRESDPDHEVGDLQDMLRSAWKIMNKEQKVKLLRTSAVREAQSWR